MTFWPDTIIDGNLFYQCNSSTTKTFIFYIITMFGILNSVRYYVKPFQIKLNTVFKYRILFMSEGFPVIQFSNNDKGIKLIINLSEFFEP